MKIINKLVFTSIFLACNLHNNSNINEFSAMYPSKYEEGVGVPSQKLDAFYPGFNIRVYCKNCNLISNNGFGFKGKLYDIKGESFSFSTYENHSVCKKCNKDILDHSEIISVYDVVFSRCSYEWKGKFCKPYNSMNNDNVIFDDKEKLSFHTKVVKLNNPNQYRLYNKESFKLYSYLTIRCTEI